MLGAYETFTLQLIWLDNLHRRGVYGFYRSYMPYTRISRKEQIALLINDVETLSPDSDIKAEQISLSINDDETLSPDSDIKAEQIRLSINDDEHTCPPDSYIRAEQILASLRLRPIGEFNLLNGMLVHPDHRGKGIGHQLMKRVADKLTSKETYLFSLPHLVEFYQKHGFSQDVQAPNDIEQIFNKYTSQGKHLVMMGYTKVNNQNR